jgi:charged multivesicular body protein 2A
MGNQQPTPEERMREAKRLINRGVRELDRERNRLQNEEKKIINEIKALAKKGQIAPCKTLAKDLVRSRRYVTKFYEMKSKLQGVGLQLQTVKSTHAMAQALKGVTNSMKAFNKTMNNQELNNIMKEFMRENERMGLTEEMMGDAIDMAIDQEGDVEASDQVVNQVLSEIGIEVTDQIGDGVPIVVGMKEERKEPQLDDLEARFNNLR